MGKWITSTDRNSHEQSSWSPLPHKLTLIICVVSGVHTNFIDFIENHAVLGSTCAGPSKHDLCQLMYGFKFWMDPLGDSQDLFKRLCREWLVNAAAAAWWTTDKCRPSFQNVTKTKTYLRWFQNIPWLRANWINKKLLTNLIVQANIKTKMPLVKYCWSNSYN